MIRYNENGMTARYGSFIPPEVYYHEKMKKQEKR